MPLCPHCSNPFTCNCGSKSKGFGAVAADCPKKPGSVWVHVTDDRGIDVAGVKTKKDGDPRPTDESGTAVFKEVEPGPHTVVLEPLSETLLLDFEEVNQPSIRSITVAPGQLAYVPYQLSRKAALTVRVLKKKGRTAVKYFYDATVATDGTERRSEKTQRELGVADFGRVKAGPYSLTVALEGEDAKTFATKRDFSKEVEPVSLAAGQQKAIDIEVEEINVVGCTVDIDKKKLILDEEDLDVGCVVLALTQTNPDHPYTSEIKFKCESGTDVEAFLDDKCTQPLDGSLADGAVLPAPKQKELHDGNKVNVYLRGKTQQGQLKISLLLAKPDERFVTLGEQATPVDAEIEVLARPHVKIEWMGTGTGVENVDIAFAGFGSKHDVPKSLSTGFAKWATQGIKPGMYDTTFTFSDNIAYLLHNDKGDPVITPQVDLQHKGAPVTFKIRKAKLKLVAKCETPGKGSEEVGAKVTLKALASQETLVKGSGAKLLEIPIVEVNQKCLIEKFEPDDATEVYELDEVKPV